MPDNLQADVGLMHVVGGHALQAPPPGTLALGAPRRAARGRVHDFLFVNLKLETNSPVQLDRLAQEMARYFFGAPGSVTTALRAAINLLNQELRDRTATARLATAALRNQNLYLAQCGPSQLLLIRSGAVTRFRAEEASSRSLGATLAPLIQFRHLELRPQDQLVLTTNDAPLWSDSALAELSRTEHSAALDRLVASAAQDFTGLAVHIPGHLSPMPAPGQAPAPIDPRPEVRVRSGARSKATPSTRPALAAASASSSIAAPNFPSLDLGVARRAPTVRPAGRSEAPSAPQAPVGPFDSSSPRRPPASRSVASAGGGSFPARRPMAGLSLGSRRLRLGLGARLRSLFENLRTAAANLDIPPVPGMFSPNLLAFTAVAIPVLVVVVSSLVYFRRGRLEQFDSYLAQAQAAAAAATLAPDSQTARTEWIMADQWLDLAESYRQTEASQLLRQQVQSALDAIDLIFRLDFSPTVSGGFGSNADLELVAASSTDLYTYDRGETTIWHAWSTGRGYEIDSQFECLAGKNSVPGFGDPISLMVQGEPGALGAEGMVAIDSDGTLLYCAPGAQPLTGQLAAPDIGWGKLQAVEVAGNSLYVLDPVKNAVWIYDATGGLFSGSPALYFAEQVPQLGTAVDLALALDELIILYADGRIDRCQRSLDNAPDGSLRIRVECEPEPRFQDERSGQPPRTNLPGGQPVSLEYSPPPEPSLFFFDLAQGTVYHYSMRLVYQGQYPTPFGSEIRAITSGPPNSLFAAVGDQVFTAQLGR